MKVRREFKETRIENMGARRQWEKAEEKEMEGNQGEVKEGKEKD